ncbi:MAG: LysE family transporter [Clostridiales bacterium]|nr:LysE family transporter [Clostridiales bacterium]
MSGIIQGLLLGFAYVAPIGVQNMYIINTSLKSQRLKALQVTLIMIMFDISLAFACYWGIGLVLDRIDILKFLIQGVGSLALLWIGIGLLKSNPKEEKSENYDKTLLKIVTACFVVTWLNPQAIVDGTLLLGSFKASLSNGESSLFIIGVCLASATWFLTLHILVSRFKNVFNKRVLKVINVVCGVILIGFSVKLLVGVSAMIL